MSLRRGTTRSVSRRGAALRTLWADRSGACSPRTTSNGSLRGSAGCEGPSDSVLRRLLDIPVVQQRQVPTVLTLLVQFLGKVDVPVVVQRQVRGSFLQKTVVCPQLQFPGLLHPCRGAVADPLVSLCPQTIEFLQLQSIDKVVFVFLVQVVQVSPVQVVGKTGPISVFTAHCLARQRIQICVRLRRFSRFSSVRTWITDLQIDSCPVFCAFPWFHSEYRLCVSLRG